VKGLADLIAVFHDARSLTIENNAVLSHSDLIYYSCFGECHNFSFKLGVRLDNPTKLIC